MVFQPIGGQSVRRSVRILVTAKPGPIVPVNFSASLEDYFKLLVGEEILEIIVHHTNDMLSIQLRLWESVSLSIETLICLCKRCVNFQQALPPLHL